MQQRRKSPVQALSSTASVSQTPGASSSNSAVAASMSQAPEEAGYLDTFMANTAMPDKEGIGEGMHKGTGFASAVTGYLPGAAGGVLRAVGGAGRMIEAVNDDDRSMLQRGASLARGTFELAGGATQAASPFIQGAGEAAKNMPILGGALGLAKMGDSLANATSDEGMSVMNGLDAVQGGLSAIGGFGGSSLSAVGGTALTELGTLGVAGGATAAASVLGAGIGGWKLGDYIADNTGVDEAIGDGMADFTSFAAEGLGFKPTLAADLLGGGMLEDAAEWMVGE